MSDIWSGVQWWDAWQLRILVVGSLGFQWFLVLVVPLRNYTVHHWIRACIRLASICADVLAIYALATLLCRQAAGMWMTGGYYGSRVLQVRSLPLEALWAPLLLVHLGGREELTASGMDDDGTALWVRHAAVLVTVTVYAFSTSLRYFSDSSDGRRLLASAALLLVAAVVSSCGKPWVLRRASVRRLVAMSSLAKGARRTAKTKHTSGGWSEWCFGELGDRYKCWKELKPRGTAPMLSQGDKVLMLLSGLSLHAARAMLEPRKKKKSETKPDQKILEPLKPWRREQHEALGEPPEVDMIMKPWLRQAFGLIYTRATAMFTRAYLACHALLVPSLYVAATVLFFFAVSYKKHGHSRYSRADVNTTYVLLCFTAALDVLGMFVSEVMRSLLSSWSCQNLPGHNLLDSVLWTIRWPTVSMLLLRCYKGGYSVKDEDRLYVRVLHFITKRLEDKDTDKNKDDKDKDKIFDLDLSSYRSLNKRNWILRDEDLEVVRGNKLEDEDKNKGDKDKDKDKYKGNIRDNLCKKPFDASVLIWHIATDLCFRVKPPNYFRFRPPHDDEVAREVCTEAISNYMAYLLDSWPEMLMAGSRQHLFTEAMANMEHVIREATKGLRPKLEEKQQLDDVILGNIKKEAAELKDKEAYTVIDDACKLAEELLLGIPEDKTRWELMHRVWVGMLCYSASMCRGDLHAKSLGEGGEFLSYVWLIISLMGGRTLADKLQMPDDDPEPEGKVVETPAGDNKGEQNQEPEAPADKVEIPDSDPKNKRRAGIFTRPG